MGSPSAGPVPLVSVVMPAYNAAPYLAEAVQSVLSQTCQDLELIIVDDGSTDETLLVARRLAAHDIRVRIISTPNGGPATARNTALRIARGAFLALLDSDDVIAPHYLATQLGLLDANPDASIVTANAINRGGGVNFDGKPYWTRTSGIEPVTAVDLIRQEDAICILSVFRRRVYETIGGFNPEFSGNEDYEFWLRAILAGFVVVRNYEPLGFYRRHQGSLSSDEPRMIRGVVKVLRHTDELLPAQSLERDALHRQIERFLVELPRAELRASLQRRDATATASALRTLPAQAAPWVLVACARVLSKWPQPLLWAYQIRQCVRAAARQRTPAQ
jgi:glycosyltransferase involved in cell wall biosynthesis